MQPEPIATYRLQLQPGFGFEQAAELVSYLADLGISHLYTSPFLQAVEDSTHGYDVVDPTSVNMQLGTADSHRLLCESLKNTGLGLMIDVVPNHMAIVDSQNPWWWDVLENGPSSPFAMYFDIDWEASEERWPHKILLPVLSDHYGRILENGQLQLSHQEGRFILCYQEHSFPIDPSSLDSILAPAANACNSEWLAFISESYARLPRPTVTLRQSVKRRHRDKAVLYQMLSKLCMDEPASDRAINNEVERMNHNPDALDAFINRQNYRLALWRMASKDLGYRRFFDIKDLVGLRTENTEVFNATHALPMAWFQKGWVQGLRIDHPDGLRNPAEYFNRLQEVFPGSWIVAEKILMPGEKLPANWKVAGTTGYEFLFRLNELFTDPQGEKALTNIYQDIVGELSDFKTVVRTCKRLVLKELLGSELNQLTHLFVDICERHRRHRDYTRSELKEALCETAVCFPVYRSYVSATEKFVTPEDEKYITEAIHAAKDEKTDLDPELFHFLRDILLLRIEGNLEEELVMRFQQLTGPAMAKGYEDTALYRYNRMIFLNEVGGDPSQFGLSLTKFHEACLSAQKEYPLSLLASTTHDTKRSEDVRARLALLSEIPEVWSETVKRWMALNEGFRKENLPDRNTEYFFYQTLVGAWPIDLQRLGTYMVKAIREAKKYTSWMKPDEMYEKSVLNFINDVMQDPMFCADFENFITPLIFPGRINSLAQTLIKLTAPGIPDIYQGSELWNLSLVDPDNRRPVNFAERRRLLDEMKKMSLEDIMSKMDEGMPKLWIIRETLQLRRKHPDLFGLQSTYRPIYAQGKKADYVVAFIRGEQAVTIVPRFILQLDNQWADTVVELPTGSWENILTGEKFNGGLVGLQALLARFPVGLLMK